MKKVVERGDESRKLPEDNRRRVCGGIGRGVVLFIVKDDKRLYLDSKSEWRSTGVRCDANKSGKYGKDKNRKNCTFTKRECKYKIDRKLRTDF